MKNSIIRKVDVVLSFILMAIMCSVWVLLVCIAFAVLKLAQIVSNICTKCFIHMGKACDSYEYVKETVDSANRRLCNGCVEPFKELLTKMFKVEA